MKRIFLLIILATSCFFLARATDYYVDATTGSNSIGDGTSGNPWQTITYALSQITGSGHTVYVAAGTYDTTLGETFPILMKNGVSLVGAGMDVSIINADGTNTVIKCVGIVDGTTRVEGFTIEGGGNVSQGAGIYISAGSVVKIINNKIVDNINSEAAGGAGAGIYVMSSSPVISDNFISGNDAGWQVSTGGAIYVSNASSAMVISNNTITGNSPGDYSVEAGGIDIIDCSPLIIGNFISGNSGYYGNASGLRINGSSSSPRILNNIITKNGEGIECKGSAKPSIINNTISDNNNDGILIYSANPDSIMNNILSLNSGYGIREYNSSSDPGKVWYNLFYANSSGLYCDEGSTDYYTLNSLNTGVTECESNIDGDPGFVDRINDDYHLRAGSPAIDSGDPTLDYSNEPSPNGGRINIGGYGNTTEAATSDAGPPALPESLYVDAMNGNNATGDGFSGNPWQTITYALSQISNSSHTVYVAAGTYDTSLGETFPVLMKDSVSLVGVGMDLSIVDAGGNNRVISCVGIVDPSTKVQGFTLKGGGNVDQGAGLFISAGSVLEIVDNRITGNSNISYAGKGGGIYVENSSPSILNNTITGNSAGPQFAVAGGIYTLNSFSLIQNNTISGNTGTGIYVVAASPLIHANIIKWNTLTTLYDGKDGSGLYVSGSSSSPRISQNVIANNAKEGIECETSANPVIINNTISENSDNGIYISSSVPDSIFNNILSLNSEYGIYENGSSSDPGKVWYNLFYANSSGLYHDEGTTDYYTANSLNTDVAECANNIDGDPMFVDRVNGDYRLSLGSPAIDAGDPDPQFNDPDGSRNDMGAYYYVGLSSENDILTFSFPEQTGTANIDNVNHTVDIEVAYDTDVSALIATFTISNWATITIGSTPQESGITTNDFTNPVTYTLTAENGTTQDWMVTVTVATSLSSENDILTYSFPEQTGAATIDDVNYTVDIEVAYGTDVSGLVATFTISDLATIAVGATTQVSGITTNDFTNPVTYTLTAENGTTQDWMVTVTVATSLSSENDILTYSFTEQTSAATINDVNHTVYIEVEYGIDVTTLTATFTISALANITISTTSQVSGITSNDFSSPVTYTVTAEDGTTQDWIVTVATSLNSENDILTYSFNEQTGPATIDDNNHTVDIEVVNGTDVTSLVATFTLSTGASATVNSAAQESGVTANDFTNPVTYTITAEEDTIQDWMVTVTVATSLSSENDILTYSFAEQTGAATIDDVNHTVNIEVAYGTDLSNLVATFTISALANIIVDTTTQVSGVTANNFTNPVTYTVTAENGTTQDWVVTVSEAGIPVISDFPYSEDFESGNGGWRTGGANSSWQLGDPVGPTINSAASGSAAWVTNLIGDYNQNEISYVTSPRFDLSGIDYPKIEFSIWWDAEGFYDGANFQYKQGTGVWKTLGTDEGDDSWYNSSYLYSIEKGFGFDINNSAGWSGDGEWGYGSDGWVTVSHALTGIDNTSVVTFRIAFASNFSYQNDGVAIDDINIFSDPTGIDAAKELLSDIQIYPNPNEGKFRLVYNGERDVDLKLQLINLQGQVILSEQIEAGYRFSKEFELEYLSAGIYYFRLMHNEGVVVMKMVIK